GITALQMDIKIKELPKEVMVKALTQAKAGRLHILDRMLDALDVAREDISPYAPKIVRVEVKKDKIREIIGPGGKMIREIQSTTNTTIEINDDGIVKIAGENEEEVKAALKIVTDIAVDPEPGEIFDGKVVKIADFGAFVNIKTGTDGLVHISELAHKRVNKVTDVVKEGDTLKVKVLAVSRDGKIKLSHKALLDK
ncbi:MAG: S1 RNA-binding domain-containing protein, partial [Desulfobacteraceae bacterium]|nr:S1 RNA-binding domain-containing protein [Desulfobacteraceae bacterium]